MRERKVCVKRAYSPRFHGPGGLLNGEVEVDDTVIGGVKSGRWRGRASTGKTVVMIAAEIRGVTICRISLQVITAARGDSSRKEVSR